MILFEPHLNSAGQQGYKDVPRMDVQPLEPGRNAFLSSALPC